eukprot:TRINITY_DN7475_c0_g1_i1.p1 TRINITY_DN7475_c0_g1~~TRINITY_DN7475_c0_g1_i1.p1  ORF type:complete len:639 (-),score=198.56 TRINITY_DN7475_c0_g1_i1:26-1942(-)
MDPNNETQLEIESNNEIKENDENLIANLDDTPNLEDSKELIYEMDQNNDSNEKIEKIDGEINNHIENNENSKKRPLSPNNDATESKKRKEDNNHEKDKEDIENQSTEKEIRESFDESEQDVHTCKEQQLKLEHLDFDPNLPDEYIDKWDEYHVKLPCSPSNTYRRRTEPEKKLNKWYLIGSVLSYPITNTQELDGAINAYNSTEVDIEGFSKYLDNLHQKQKIKFFSQTLPFIIKLILRTPHLFKDPIPLLVPQVKKTVKLTQIQVACLMANGFMCTIPKGQGVPSKEARKENKNLIIHEYPEFNFGTLFEDCSPSKVAKFECLLNYFKRIEKIEKKGKNVMPKLSFERKVLDKENLFDWSKCDKKFLPIEIFEKGFIEDSGNNNLHVDFANKYIGGGVLSSGCVQEEIRFMINTESIVSRLFTAVLEDNEALLISGAQRYCNYKGYSKSFRYFGDFRDIQEFDEEGHIKSYIIAIDALNFSSHPHMRLFQYSKKNIMRELYKILIGFSGYNVKNPHDENQIYPQISTGNIGCGVFSGYLDLKAVLQLMAASVSGHKLLYYSFEERGLKDSLLEFHKLLVEHNITVSSVFNALSYLSLSMFPNYTENLPESFYNDDPEIKLPQLFNHLIETVIQKKSK